MSRARFGLAGVVLVLLYLRPILLVIRLLLPRFSLLRNSFLPLLVIGLLGLRFHPVLLVGEAPCLFGTAQDRLAFLLWLLLTLIPGRWLAVCAFSFNDLDVVGS